MVTHMQQRISLDLLSSNWIIDCSKLNYHSFMSIMTKKPKELKILFLNFGLCVAVNCCYGTVLKYHDLVFAVTWVCRMLGDLSVGGAKQSLP